MSNARTSRGRPRKRDDLTLDDLRAASVRVLSANDYKVNSPRVYTHWTKYGRDLAISLGWSYATLARFLREKLGLTVRQWLWKVRWEDLVYVGSGMPSDY